MGRRWEMRSIGGACEGGDGFLRRLWCDDGGQDATEYALLVVLIALAVTAGMTALTASVNAGFGRAAERMESQASG